MASPQQYVQYPAKAGQAGAFLAVFGATLFLSAFLLFSVQPLYAKMVLPLLGGSAAVWSFALVFFQAVLLAGYAYAHASIRWLRPATGLAVHGAILALGYAALPAVVPETWVATAGQGDLRALGALFFFGVGLPFFAVSSTAPLLQAWFSRLGHAQSADPYFLYGASNLGSFAALAAYPFLVEPLMPLTVQRGVWTGCYAVLALGVLACGWSAARVNPSPRADAGAGAEKPSARRMAAWLALAAIPSGLLVSVTAHLSTDLVSAPFLWTLPLALFLLTFIIVFQRRPFISHQRAIWMQSVMVAPIAATLFAQKDAEIVMAGLHLFAFFVSAMVCHGALASLRPDSRHLTLFYLVMSLGGLLGGIFASLLAPRLFNTVLEHPILLAAAFFGRTDVWAAIARERAKSAACLLIGAAVIAVVQSSESVRHGLGPAFVSWSAVVLAAMTIAAFLLRRAPVFQVTLVCCGVFLTTALVKGAPPLHTTRSFFGVHTVFALDDGAWHVLRHGTTEHGVQRWLDGNGLRVSSRPEPAAYYYPEGPLGAAIQTLRAARGPLERVGVVGLGSGALACLRAGNEEWRFFEIDPEVIRIAKDATYFTYLDTCGPDAAIVAGDGRLTLAAEPAGSFDLLVIDAFSSDAIPVHLLTREAFDLYRTRLKPGGAVLLHISNRFMSLGDVVAASAGAPAYWAVSNPADWPYDSKRQQYGVSAVMVPGKSETAFAADKRWRKIETATEADVWTDDHSNVLRAIWKHR